MAALCALGSASVAALVVAVQLGLAFCSQRIAVPVPSVLCGAHWLGQFAPADTAFRTPAQLEICPITLAVVLLAALANGWAILMLRRERCGIRHLLRLVGALPVHTTTLVMTAAAFVPVTVMLADLPNRYALAATLAAVLLLFAATSAVALLVICGARCLLHVVCSAVLRLLAAFVVPRERVRPGAVRFRVALPALDASVLSAGFGLRAPPVHHSNTR